MSNEHEHTVGNGTPSLNFGDEMAEILESFFVETHEILERLGQDLLSLEKKSSDSELHNSIFRAVHTIKGTSSFLGFEQMTELAHSFEDVLNKLRNKELTVTPAFIDVLFEAYDLMKVLLQRIETKNNEPVALSNILEKLQTIAQSGSPRNVALWDSSGAEASEAIPVEEEHLPVPAQSLAETAESIVSVEVASHQPAQSVAPPQKAGSSSAAGAGASKLADSTIRVDVRRLDSLMNLVGELVLCRNRLSQIAYQMGEQYESIPVVKELSETGSQIDFITTELQMAVMKTRMVPIAKVFNKLPRLARDLAKETGKEIELQIHGEETELDKSIIEELNDPLVHILRNAVDHGIELPEKRQRAGKPPKGTVVIKAEHEGNHIVISIQDDGKGMDPEELKQKAVEKGLVSETQAAEMSKRDAFNLIFEPGFSTAQKVTNVSGRGVGMDVVRTNITKLKGLIDIDSEMGVGSKFTIKLPLTLAIIQGLLVLAKKEIFAVPLNSVLEVVRVHANEINTIHGREVIRLRNSVLPLVRLADVLGVSANGERTQWMYVVVLGLAEQRVGIAVDSLLGQKEVVIKSLGGYLGNVRAIAGSTILGDGKVVMIIDVSQLMQLCAAGRQSYSHTAL